MNEKWVTIRMPKSSWAQIEDDLSNMYGDALSRTEVGAEIVVTEDPS